MPAIEGVFLLFSEINLSVTSPSVEFQIVCTTIGKEKLKANGTRTHNYPSVIWWNHWRGKHDLHWSLFFCCAIWAAVRSDKDRWEMLLYLFSASLLYNNVNDTHYFILIPTLKKKKSFYVHILLTFKMLIFSIECKHSTIQGGGRDTSMRFCCHRVYWVDWEMCCTV